MPNDQNASPNVDNVSDLSTYIVPLTTEKFQELLRLEAQKLVERFPYADTKQLEVITGAIDMLQAMTLNPVLDDVKSQLIVPIDWLKARLLATAYPEEDYLEATFSIDAEILQYVKSEMEKHWAPEQIERWQKNDTIQGWVTNGHVGMLLSKIDLRAFLCDPHQTRELLVPINDQLAALGVAGIMLEEQLGFVPDAGMLSAMAGVDGMLSSREGRS